MPDFVPQVAPVNTSLAETLLNAGNQRAAIQARMFGDVGNTIAQIPGQIRGQQMQQQEMQLKQAEAQRQAAIAQTTLAEYQHRAEQRRLGAGAVGAAGESLDPDAARKFLTDQQADPETINFTMDSLTKARQQRDQALQDQKDRLGNYAAAVVPYLGTKLEGITVGATLGQIHQEEQNGTMKPGTADNIAASYAKDPSSLRMLISSALTNSKPAMDHLREMYPTITAKPGETVIDPIMAKLGMVPGQEPSEQPQGPSITPPGQPQNVSGGAPMVASGVAPSGGAPSGGVAGMPGAFTAPYAVGTIERFMQDQYGSHPTPAQQAEGNRLYAESHETTLDQMQKRAAITASNLAARKTRADLTGEAGSDAANRAWSENSAKLASDLKGPTTVLKAVTGLNSLLDAHTQEADSVVAKQLLAVMQGGEGQPRLSVPILNKIEHGRATVQDIQATLAKVAGGRGTIPDEQREELRDIGAAFQSVAQAEAKNVTDTMGKLSTASVDEHHQIMSNYFQGKVAAAKGPAVPAGVPAVGAIINGYSFKGGDPNDKANWSKVSG